MSSEVKGKKREEEKFDRERFYECVTHNFNQTL
jgi:hypothetical protein